MHVDHSFAIFFLNHLSNIEYCLGTDLCNVILQHFNIYDFTFTYTHVFQLVGLKNGNNYI